jgi:hypothetical protein
MIGERVLRKEADEGEVRLLNTLLREKGMSDGQIKDAAKKIAIFLDEHFLYVEMRNVLDFIRNYDWGYDMDNSAFTYWFKSIVEIIEIIEKGIKQILQKKLNEDEFSLAGEFVAITRNGLGIISVYNIKTQVENHIKEKLENKVVKKY